MFGSRQGCNYTMVFSRELSWDLVYPHFGIDQAHSQQFFTRYTQIEVDNRRNIQIEIDNGRNTQIDIIRNVRNIQIEVDYGRNTQLEIDNGRNTQIEIDN